MEIASTLNKISSIMKGSGIRSSRPINTILNEIKESSFIIKALKTIISMIQRGEDVSELYGEIIKIIDTSDHNIKSLCNQYLLLVCSERPAIQLMCVHTFLKDFNDRNINVQRLALIYSVLLSDEIIVKNYVKEIKRLAFHTNTEIKIAATRSLSILFLKNKKLFIKEKLVSCLRVLLKDSNYKVSLASLNAFSIIEATDNLIQMKYLIQILKYHIYQRNEIGIRYSLNVLKYKRLHAQHQNLYLSLTSTSDICILYLVFTKLLEAGLTTYQAFYERLREFYNTEYEEAYNIYLLICSFVDRITVISSDFAILDSDPEFIKDIKIEILFKINDEFSKGEIERLVVIEYNIMKIFEMSIKYKILISSLFEKIENENRDKILLILQKYFWMLLDITDTEILVDNVWQKQLSVFLNNFKTGFKNEHTLIELCSKVCNNIPKTIFKLYSKENCMHLIKYFIVIMNRNIITEEHCMNYLGKIKDSMPYIPTIDIVTRNLNHIDPEFICKSLLNSKPIPKSNPVDFEILKDYSNDLLIERPFNNEEVQRPLVDLNDLFDNDSAENNILDNDLKTVSDENNDIERHINGEIGKSKSMMFLTTTLNSERYETSHLPMIKNKIKVSTFPIFIDTRNFKSVVSFSGSEIFLDVDIIELPTVFHFKLGNESKFRNLNLTNEGKYSLTTVDLNNIGDYFSCVLNEMNFTVCLNIKNLIKNMKVDEAIKNKIMQEYEAFVIEKSKFDELFGKTTPTSDYFMFSILGNNILVENGDDYKIYCNTRIKEAIMEDIE